MTSLSAEVLQKLRSFDTPTICNLIELFEVRPRNVGFMNGTLQANFPEMPPMVGFAATATCRTAGEPPQGSSYFGLPDQAERFAELAGAPVVVFQDLDQPVCAATFGEVMCTAYQAFGAQGLITSGAGRDLEQVRALNFPVFTGSTIASHGYIHIIDIHVPVHVGGCFVYPDDLIHGDLNGITTIPRAIAQEVAAIGDAFVAAEKIMLDALRTEGLTPARFREAIHEARNQINALREQVRRR
ncbi:MAG: RraA family protein [Anaerolineae bacterium]|nr:RraA family protein [Anaerolineae bacterium]